MARTEKRKVAGRAAKLVRKSSKQGHAAKKSAAKAGAKATLQSARRAGTAPSAAKPPAALDIAGQLIELARKSGADAADALFVRGTQLSLAERLGRREKLERSEGHDLGLRVFIGHRQASVSTTDFAAGALKELAERAVAMAREVPEDPFCGIAEAGDLARRIPDLDLDDGGEPSVALLTDWVRRAEHAARAVTGVTNSEGAEAAFSRNEVAMAASNGFAARYARAGYSLSVSVLAGTGTAMERDYEWTSAVHRADLDKPETVGRKAGQRAIKRLGARAVKSGKFPVVYDPRVSGGLLGHLTGAINGRAIARGTSFLKDSMGKRIFAAGIDVIDDPLRKRGLRSRPFDGEGLATRRMKLIDKGKLTTWLLDLAAARQLKLKSTGHAARGTSGPPSPSASNLYLAPGKNTPKQLIADIESGFYVNELIGFGVNGVTGDYSRGASGFWIERGKLAFPVSGVTVAGNLKDMFLAMTPANDLKFRTGSDAPTVRIDVLTVAGL